MSSGKGMTDEFRTEEVTVRGVTYKFRELSAEEYDEILKIAAGPDDNAELATVLKLMAGKSLVEPEMDPATLGKKPYPVYNKLLQTVNRMHFSLDAADGGEAPNS